MTFEVVLDNTKMLANCLEEAPLPAIIVDLPAWHCNDIGGSGDYNQLSTPDTGSEMIITPANRIGVGYFAESDQGAIVSLHWIYMPDTPDGYALARATYVVIAYQEESRPGVNTEPLTNYYPDTGIHSNFLNAETSATINNYAIDPIPVGAYSGEIEWSGNESLSYLTGPPGTQFPCTRLWNEWSTVEGYSATNDMHVAYYAVRLYYNPV